MSRQGVSEGKPSGLVCRCGGSGKLSYTDTFESPSGRITGTTRGSHPCPCRSQLPPRYGTASWWSLEQIHSEIVPLLFSDDVCEIRVEVEVPYSEDNYRLHRTLENAYYPAFIHIEGIEPSSASLPLYVAEGLSAAIANAVGIAQKADEPVPEPDISNPDREVSA